MEVLRDIPQLALILLPRERERAGPKDLNGLDASSESATQSRFLAAKASCFSIDSR